MSRMDIRILNGTAYICVASIRLINSIEDYQAHYYNYKERTFQAKTEDFTEFCRFIENKYYTGGWHSFVLNTDMAHAVVDICNKFGYETEYSII